MTLSKANHTLMISMTLVSLLFVITLLYRCNFGIDLTDEGYYLNLISNPWIYEISATQFGYIYHPLYQLVGESIVRLRQADMLIMLGLAWILCAKLLSFVLIPPGKLRTYPSYYLHGLSFALATCVFTFFGTHWWISTPSYNSLTLEGLLIISIAMLNIPLNKNHIINSCILGVGGWLTFMGKPTSAVCSGLIVLLYILTVRSSTLKKTSFLLLSLLVFVVAFITSAWMIAGSLQAFVLGLQHAAKMPALLSGGQSFDLFPTFAPFLDKHSGLIFIVSFIPFFLSLNLSPLSKSKAHIGFIYTLLTLSFFICIDHYVVPFDLNSFKQGGIANFHIGANGFLIYMIPLGIGLTIFLMNRKPLRTPESINALILALFFASLPYTFSLGTQFVPWLVSLRMGLFSVLFAIPLIKLLKQPQAVYWRMLLTIVITSQLITIVLVQLGMEHPYRQLQSLRSLTKTIDVINTKGRVTSQLTVGDEDALHINKLRDIAITHGFQPGDAMIDLTGAYPTILYLLGAKVIGSPWYIAGFEGSVDIALSSLSHIPCHDVATAWVLTSLNGPGRYSLKLLKPHGIDETSFQALPPFIDARNYQQQLLKPIRPHDEAIQRCEKMRPQLQQSQDLLKKIMKKSLPSSKEIIALSQAYITENKLDQAVVLLTHATRINPSNPIFYNHLCFTYALQKEYDRAIDACSQAIQLHPDFALAKNNLAWAMQAKHQRA